METLLTLYATKKLIACKTILIIIVYNVLTYTICNNDKQTITFLYIVIMRVDKVLPGSSKNPYRYMISDVFGTLFIIKVLL